jgi:hypothetical protein
MAFFKAGAAGVAGFAAVAGLAAVEGLAAGFVCAAAMDTDNTNTVVIKLLIMYFFTF